MTRKEPVVDQYFDTQVTDDYRWLENGEDPEVQRWTAAQTQYARSYLERLPHRANVEKRVTELLTSSSSDYFGLVSRPNGLFALQDQPPKQQPFLIIMKSADDPASARVLVDPNLIDPSGKTAVDFFVPSRDGMKVAVSLSSGGSEDGTVHVYDVLSGKETVDVIPRVNGGTAGGSVAWNATGTAFWYTRYPHPEERAPADLGFYQQVWFHELGTPVERDRYAGKEFPRIAETELESSDDGKYVLARVANGDGGEFAHYLLNPNGRWHQFAKFEDKIIDARLGKDGKIYLISLLGKPRGAILRLDPRRPLLSTAEVVVEESDGVIQGLEATRSRLYVADLEGGPSRLRVFDTTKPGKAKSLPLVPILAVSSVQGMLSTGDDELLFRNQSFLEPPAWFRFVPKSAQVTRTSLYQTSIASFADAEVVREACKSKDGTLIPLNVLRKKGTPLDGSNPTLLSGYGGYGISMSPRFRPIWRLWLDYGGVFALANLRGGGEFGEAWHLSGNLTKKQNVFDDFAACAEHLIQNKITNPAKLAILGGSNGGLLMGAALTQHPELFRAVVSYVGLYDMLRVELSPNGAFNVTEFGSVKDRAQFEALYRYSPYHAVKEGIAYPPVLFVTGANDPRVDPYHSRKMTARLQASAEAKKPILLRASTDTGHGGATPLSSEIAENVDVYSFLFAQLGMTAR